MAWLGMQAAAGAGASAVQQVYTHVEWTKPLVQTDYGAILRTDFKRCFVVLNPGSPIGQEIDGCLCVHGAPTTPLIQRFHSPDSDPESKDQNDSRAVRGSLEVKMMLNERLG